MSAASTNSPDSGDWTSPQTHPLMLKRRRASAAPASSTVHYICTFLPSAFIQPISDVVVKTPSETRMAQPAQPLPAAFALTVSHLGSEISASMDIVAEPESPGPEAAGGLAAAAFGPSAPQMPAVSARTAQSSMRSIEAKAAGAELNSRVDQLVGALARFNRQVSALARDDEPMRESSATPMHAVWEASDMLKNVENMRVALRKFDARERVPVGAGGCALA